MKFKLTWLLAMSAVAATTALTGAPPRAIQDQYVPILPNRVVPTRPAAPASSAG